ncbi:MAG: twin-arginine translocase subunit TatC [Woeseiaceae bacterium]|nr:twin-arginine translocase subunit TatC [Woeseiaceae bacterium]
MSAGDDNEEQLAEGTLLSHLVELRTRLVKIFAAVLVVFVCLVPFANDLFRLASKPIIDVLPNNQMIATGVASPLLTPFVLTAYLALFIAMPVVLYQVWAFVAPGLYKREKRFAIPLFATSVLLFYLGLAFAYFVVFPLIFAFFTATTPQGVEFQPDIRQFLDFALTIVLAFGIAFEVPIATVLVVWTGLTTPQKLGKARPYVFLGAFVVGMFLTPPDVISQTLLAVPVYLLYELGIFMSRIFVRRKEEEADEAEAV